MAVTPDALVNQWRRGLRIGQRAHYESAKHYYRMHLVLSLPTVLISAALSTTVFAALNDSKVEWIKAVMGVLSVATVVLTSLQAALRLAERSERHKTAAVQLGEVRRELEQQLVFDHHDEATIERLRKKWDAVDRQAPTIPSRIYDAAAKEVVNLGDGSKGSTA
jgi:hypothetical protein